MPTGESQGALVALFWSFPTLRHVHVRVRTVRTYFHRIYMHEASAWFGKCNIGVIVTNVKRNARVVFDGHVGHCGY